MTQNIERRTFLAAGAASLAATVAHADKTVEAKSKTPNGFQKATKYYMVKPGKTLVITQCDVFAVQNGAEKLVALMQQTLMVMHGRKDHA